jgi:hypothetical protein
MEFPGMIREKHHKTADWSRGMETFFLALTPQKPVTHPDSFPQATELI